MQKMKPKCVTTPYEWRCKKCQSDKSRCSWRGKSCKVIRGEVVITNKRSRGQLVLEVDESSSGDDVEVLEAPRGESYCLFFTL
jgi:glycerol-3-phosphate cytidylyltransferase-like family protein